MVPAGADLAAEADAAGEVGLGVDVDQEDAALGQRERRGEVDGRGGLPDATLLVGDCDYLPHLQQLMETCVDRVAAMSVFGLLTKTHQQGPVAETGRTDRAQEG